MNRYPLFFLPFLFCLWVGGLRAQGITGTVTDPAGNPLPGANVVLLSRADSVWLKGTACAKDGSFTLENIAPGSYLLGFSFIGYKAKHLTLSLPENKALGNVVMEPEETTLNQVEVKAYKPMFEQKTDRMVVNVQNSITSVGGTVLDVLQRSPGILVNREQGSISMSGKDGVQVMINGKINYMPVEALLSMLGGLNATTVEKIELITTPPAKYDAGGNAGYINIVLRQTPDAGFNGGYALTAGAFHGQVLSGNFDFNYRRGRSNLYGGLGSGKNGQVVDFNIYRRVQRQSGTFENISSSRRDGHNFDNNLRLGYDYELSKKVTLGALVSGYDNKWHMDALNRVARVNNGVTDTTLTMQVEEVNRKKNGMANLNLLVRPGSGGELSFNIDYLFYDNRQPMNYINDYYNGQGKFLFTNELKSYKNNRLRILPVQVDYTRKLSDKLSLETGLKMVRSGLTNDVLVARHEPSGWIPDPALTVNSTLKENILAAYASSAFSAGSRNSFQAGLRYEHTYSNLDSETEKGIVHRKYGQWFPTLYWSHKINDNHRLNLSYNRRINRPSFNDLAPFVLFSDPYTFTSGNAALQPAIADGVKADYIYKQYVFSISYTHEAHSIGIFQPTVDTLYNREYQITRNIDYLKTLYLSVTLPLTITPWWSAFLNLNASRAEAQTSHLGPPFRVQRFGMGLNGAQTFRLKHNISVEISGICQTPGLFGANIIHPVNILNVAAQKKFRQSTLTLAIDDVFSGTRIRVITDPPDKSFYTDLHLQFARRICKLTYTHRFGNTGLKDKRNRGTASEDMRGRL